MEDIKEQTTSAGEIVVPAKGELDKPGEKKAEQFETIDYVKELFLQGVEAEKINKKKLRWIRLIAICVLIIMLTSVAALILAGPYVESLVADFHSITMKIQEADIRSISTEALTTLTEAQSALKTVTEAAGNLQKLDMSTLNSAISELTKTVENFGKIDIAGLNASIETLAKVSQAMASIKILGKPLLG